LAASTFDLQLDYNVVALQMGDQIRAGRITYTRRAGGP
jgi:hypothetical protein